MGVAMGNRIQGAVDRRFYRSRYEPTRTLDAFGLRLRNEVDLGSVRSDLLDVVRDTVRPDRRTTRESTSGVLISGRESIERAHLGIGGRWGTGDIEHPGDRDEVPDKRC